VVFDYQQQDVGNLYTVNLEFCDQSGLDSSYLYPIADFLATSGGPWSVNFDNNSLNATSYTLDWGDGSLYTGVNLPVSHEYAAVGTYVITLIAFKGIYSDTTSQTVVIGGALPTAQLNFPIENACAPVLVTPTLVSENHVDAWWWTFPNGIPGTSTSSTPTVLYEDEVTDSISLVLSNSFGSDTLYFVYHANGPVMAAFDIVQVQGDSVFCQNLSINADLYRWYIDGTWVTLESNPILVLPPGEHVISLEAENECGIQTAFQTVFIGSISAQSPDSEPLAVRISPNPTRSDALNVVLDAAPASPLSWYLRDALGKCMATGQLSKNGLQRLDVPELPAGMYGLEIRSRTQAQTLKVVLW
jgi:hypothetical protein